MGLERGERGPHGDHGQTGDVGEAGLKGEQGEQGVQGATGLTGKAVAAFVVIVVLAFAGLARSEQTARKASDLAEENRHRISEIQMARLGSCKQTYEGIREVFAPFVTPLAQRTREQQADITKFNDTIDERKAACAVQTRVKPKGEG